MSRPPIAVMRDVTFTHDDQAGRPGGLANRRVVSDVNLEIFEGEMLLVAGRTGAGKSTLLGMLNGLTPVLTGGTMVGTVTVGGRDVRMFRPRELADVVGYVGQDPLAGFVTEIVEDELVYGLEQLGTDRQTMRRRVEEVLDLLGIADLRHRAVRSLSGGQQQRVAIGSVLTMHPQLLVLDEPTSALDPIAAEDVLATLARLVDDLGLTVVLAEHRMERVIPFADRLVIVNNAFVRAGPPRQMLAESPVVPPLIELAQCAGWEPLPLSVREARRHELMVQAPPIEPSNNRAQPALTAGGVTVSYGQVTAVDCVDLEVVAGQVMALMGRNGSGKSSLLWALQGSGHRTGGSVSVGGQDPAKVSAAARRKLVGLVPQTASDLLYLETVDDECAAADSQAQVPAGSARRLLDQFAPNIDARQHPRDLSEGQRLALVLAIILTMSPAVIALDEPTRGLDYQAKRELAATLRSLAAADHAVVVVSHDVEFVAEVADVAVVMADGQVVSQGATASVLAESPAFAPQVTKVLGSFWLTPRQVQQAMRDQPR